MKPLLPGSSLPSCWLFHTHATRAEVIRTLCYQVVNSVQPNVSLGDSMNVLHYVKINCIPGRRLEECEYVFGAVISRNVAHKKMRCEIRNPRILLLKSALELRPLFFCFFVFLVPSRRQFFSFDAED